MIFSTYGKYERVHCETRNRRKAHQLLCCLVWTFFEIWYYGAVRLYPQTVPLLGNGVDNAIFKDSIDNLQISTATERLDIGQDNTIFFQNKKHTTLHYRTAKYDLQFAQLF